MNSFRQGYSYIRKSKAIFFIFSAIIMAQSLQIASSIGKQIKMEKKNNSRIETRNFVYLARWRGQLMSALAGHYLPY